MQQMRQRLRPQTLQPLQGRGRVFHQRCRLLSSRIGLWRNEQGELHIRRLCASLLDSRVPRHAVLAGLTCLPLCTRRLMIRGAEVAVVARSPAPPKARPPPSSSGWDRGSRRAMDRPPCSAPPARRCAPTIRGGVAARMSACAIVRAARVRIRTIATEPSTSLPSRTCGRTGVTTEWAKRTSTWVVRCRARHRVVLDRIQSRSQPTLGARISFRMPPCQGWGPTSLTCGPLMGRGQHTRVPLTMTLAATPLQVAFHSVAAVGTGAIPTSRFGDTPKTNECHSSSSCSPFPVAKYPMFRTFK